MADSAPGPLSLHRETVRPEWLDFNGHMNVAYYVLAFDHATDKLFDRLGIGEAYAARGQSSMFALEAHIVYRRELLGGAPIRFTTQLLGHDEKRLHFIHHMYHESEGYLAASAEFVGAHVDLRTRRAAPFPAEVLEGLGALARLHGSLPRPPEAGRAAGLGQGRPGA